MKERYLKDRKYTQETMPKEMKAWCAKLQKVLDKIPKGTFLLADGQIHLFTEYKDGQQFEAGGRSVDGLNQANDCRLHSFNGSCDGGDFW